MRVLVIEDHPETRELVARALARDGHAVTGTRDGAEALGVVDAAEPDVIVLDLGLPDTPGVDLCRELRRRGHAAPLLVLTAHGAVACRVECLDAGADDFLPKPFAVAELRARVRALGRRQERRTPARIERGDVVLDLAARRAWRAELEVLLTAREWAILDILANAEGALVGREVLLVKIWGEANEAHSASLDVLLTRIRRKLGRERIRTLRGEGHALG